MNSDRECFSPDSSSRGGRCPSARPRRIVANLLTAWGTQLLWALCVVVLACTSTGSSSSETLRANTTVRTPSVVSADSGSRSIDPPADSLTTAIPPLEKCVADAKHGSLTFGNLITAPLSGDVSGYQVTFVRLESGHWAGDGGEAFGELAPLTPLSPLSFSRAEAKLFFGVNTLGPPTEFSVSVSCDSLWGVMQLAESARRTFVKLERVPP